MAIPRLCSIPDCGKPHEARSLCRNHYRQAYRPRRITAFPKTRSKPQREWMLRHIGYDREECLVWPFRRDDSGYGVTTHRGTTSGAARVMCIMCNGEPPSRLHQAAHSCSNGHLGCVAPNHLRWATPVEQQIDKVKNGTSRVALLDDDVRAIRAARGFLTTSELAGQYAVNRATISKIQTGRSRRNVR